MTDGREFTTRVATYLDPRRHRRIHVIALRMERETGRRISHVAVRNALLELREAGRVRTPDNGRTWRLAV